MELLEAWRNGQQRAGKLLFERHFDAIDRFFRRKAGAEASDLVQKTFLGCLEGIDNFRGEGSFRSWLFAVAYRQLCRYYRTQANEKVDFDAHTSSAQDLDPTPSSIVGRLHTHQMLLEALRKIPLEFQVALELHYWEQMSDAEIARALGVPHGTMKSRIRRGRALLAACLNEMNSAADSQERLPDAETNFEAWAEQLRMLALGPDDES